MKRSRIRTRLFVSLVLALSTAVVPTARANDAPTSFVGDVDLRPYGFITLPVDRAGVDAYVPDGFRPVELGGKAFLIAFFGIWENLSVDFEGEPARINPGPFANSEVGVLAYGPDGQPNNVILLWRLVADSVFPEAMSRLGVGCGTGTAPRTQVCKVVRMTASADTSVTGTTFKIDVPWTTSTYSLSATFAPTTLPCPYCNPNFYGWHLGARGLVRETVYWSDFPDTAIIGVGTGVVRAAGGPLYHILGGRTEATGTAVLWHGHADGEFELL